MAVYFEVKNILDAFDNGEVDIIGHCANRQHTMASGIAKQIKERYPGTYYEADFLWHDRKRKLDPDLKDVSIYQDTHQGGDMKMIFNLYGQDRYGYDGGRYLNYGMISSALVQMEKTIGGLAYFNDIDKSDLTVGFPKLMGCDRAGGDWNVVLEMIEWIFRDYNVIIYSLR